MKLIINCFFLLPILTKAQQIGSATLEVKAMPTLPSKDFFVEDFLKTTKDKLGADQYSWFYWTNYSRNNPKRFWDSVVFPILETFPNLQGANSTSLRKDLYALSTLPLLKPNFPLNEVAERHAVELASAKASPSHTSANGTTFQMRMEKAKIKKCAGENISFGPSNSVLALVLLYLDLGVSDLGHRKTLLTSSYTEMGIGLSFFTDKRQMVVQEFACDQGL